MFDKNEYLSRIFNEQKDVLGHLATLKNIQWIIGASRKKWTNINTKAQKRTNSKEKKENNLQKGTGREMRKMHAKKKTGQSKHKKRRRGKGIKKRRYNYPI